MKEKLAQIKECGLNYQERKILVLDMLFEYEDGCLQGAGGLVLDTFDKSKDARIGTAFGCQKIIDVIDAFNVNNLHEAIGQHCFVIGEGDDFSFKIKGFRSLRNNGQKEVMFFAKEKEQQKDE